MSLSFCLPYDMNIYNLLIYNIISHEYITCWHFVIKLVVLLHCNATAAVLSDWLTDCIIRFADLNSDYRLCQNQSYVDAVARNTCATFWLKKSAMYSDDEEVSCIYGGYD